MENLHIAISDLTKTFPSLYGGVTAIDRLNLDIAKGDYLAITGHSGSGKTTLLSVIGGLLRPTSGAVFVGGKDISAFGQSDLARYRAEKVGFVFQSPGLLPSLTVKENLLLPGAYLREREMSSEEKALAYLSRIGLLNKAEKLPYQLSGGEARRASLARALMNDPEILLADEPTGDLDEDTELLVMELLEEFQQQLKNTFIIVTHNKLLAMRAGRRIRMSSGRIHEEA